MTRLAMELASNPEGILQALVESAIALCRAGSVGISILEEDGDRASFRWHAIAGPFAQHLYGTMPRDYSPCGLVIARNQVMLFKSPERHFVNLRGVEPRIYENLLAPWCVNGQVVGTVWAISHHPDHEFDPEDARLLQNLAQFAAAAHQAADARRTAEEALRNKSRFLASVSHDLRQPFQAMRLFHEILRQHVGPDGARAYAALDDSMAAGEELLNVLLDMSTLEAGTVQPQIRRVTCADLVQELRDTFALHCRERGLRFFCRVTPEMVWTDPVLLRQILRNLLTNALKYTSHGGIGLVCRTRQGKMSIEVWDTGSGIPAECLREIFGEFVQLDNPERDRTRGLGLGLAISRKTAALLGGSVSVRSRLGRGSVFRILLPMVGQGERFGNDPDREGAGARSA